jgi:16S rRNA (guanine966-N2)-methyltransferase
MRVVAGRLKGRSLQGPRSDAIRPTSDRLRETIFNILSHGLAKHGIDDPVSDARVLDLFAGTGALAIEALSRGAAYAVMVDEGTEARGLQRGHVEVLGLGERALPSAIEGGWLAKGALVVLEERAGLAIKLPPQLELLDQRTAGEGQILMATLRE